MKILKGLAWLLAALLVIAVGYFIYQDKESLQLNSESRSSMPGSFVETPHGVVSYQLEGPKDAEIVVLVHGFSVPGYLWEPTFQFLKEQGYQVLRFDLFGRGRSDRPDEEFGLELFSAQIKDLLVALEIKQPINLVGLSMGGPIVSRFTHQNPGLVKRLILQDPLVHQIPAAFVSPMDKPIVGEYLAGVVLIPNLVAGNQAPENELKVKGWGEKFTEQAKYKGFRRAILSSLRYFSSHRLVTEFEKLAKTDMPKMLVWGKDDKTVPFTESETLIKLMPNMRFEAIDGAGHIPSVEKPEIFNPILLSFLQEQ